MREAKNPLSRFEEFVSRFIWIRPGEGKSVLLLFLSLFVLMFSYYLLKVIRDPLILKDGTAELKSYTTAAQAIVLFLVIPFFSNYYYKFSQHHDKSIFVRRVLAFFAFCLFIFAFLAYLEAPISIVFYIWLGVFSVTLVALYWSFCTDCFNVKSGQRLFSMIAVGGATGAWCGANAAGILFPIIGITGLLALSAGLLIVSAILVRYCQTSIPDDSRPLSLLDEPQQESMDWKRGFVLVMKQPYLLAIAVFVTLINWINSMGEYVLAKFVKQAVASSNIEPQLFMTDFYSNYIAWFTIIGLFLQLFVVSKLFRTIGIGACILILPIIMLINYGLLYFVPVFSLVKWTLVAENSVNYSIQNTSRHALFLPIPRDEKYLSKNAIDAFFYRFGDLLYAAIIFVGVTYFDFQISTFIAINFFLALIALLVAVHIRKLNKKKSESLEPNSAPILSTPIKTQTVLSGKKTVFYIPEDTFIDPDLGDAIRYKIESTDNKLPAWCRFNPTDLTLAIEPPQDYNRLLELKLIAYDFEGLEADTIVEIDIVSS